MMKNFSYSERADVAIAPTIAEAIDFAVINFIRTGADSIAKRGGYHVALSGGSTPKAIFERLKPEMLDWSKVHLYWGDERAVSPDDPESNYKMAMDAAFGKLPIPADQIHRMIAEDEIDKNAHAYQTMLKQQLPEGKFDLVMLGMGDDGHTASLFPETHALTDTQEWVTANFIPQKACWRMTLTYIAINSARSVVIYVLGKGKAPMLKQVLEGPYNPQELPIQKVGNPRHKPLWVLDKDAASQIFNNFGNNGHPISP